MRIATTTDDQRNRASTIMVAARAMIAGALLDIVLGIPLAPLQDHDPGLWQIGTLNAVSHLLLLAGVAGLALTALGLADLTLAEAVWALAGEDAAVLFYSTSTLALMLGPILAGMAIVRAGRWDGWRRYTVLATGLFIPLILVPAFALPGYGPNFAIGAWGICWLLVGLALRQRPATAEERAAPRLAGLQHPRPAQEGSLS